MKPLSNEIVLRPRFKFLVNSNKELVLELFEAIKNETNFKINRIDNHVFIKIAKEKQHFWSPQLHLEINSTENENQSIIYGLFGPSPSVWTMFMFFHFVIIGLFLAFGIWTFTNWNLNNSYAIQLFITLFMVVIWFTLYFIGRIGKKAGNDEMYELHHFMRDTLRSKSIHTIE